MKAYLLSKYGLQALAVLLATVAGLANALDQSSIWPIFIVLAGVSEIAFLVWSFVEADVSVASLRPLARAQARAMQSLGSALWDRWTHPEWSAATSLALGQLEKGSRAALGLPGAAHQLTVNLMLVLPYTDDTTSSARQAAISLLLGEELVDLYGGAANSGLRLDLCDAPGHVAMELLTIHRGLVRTAPPLILRQHKQSNRVMFGAPRAVENCHSRPSRAEYSYGFWERADYVADASLVAAAPLEDPALAGVRDQAASHLKRNGVRSFVSIALLHSGEVVGVVNINCSKARFLSSAKHQALFFAFGEPIFQVLGFLAFVYRERYEEWARAMQEHNPTSEPS